jgi:4-amino-4-deoxy-L-arabinose transferase-like glycosyltransferase
MSSAWTRPAVAVPLRRYESILTALGWALVCWVIIFWRLGYPSFWDPDEAHYAQTTREMLASGDWLVPQYNGAPYFEKPVLFHLLQMAPFALLGPTEFAARLVPAVSALALFAVTAWLGKVLFDSATGRTAALLLVVLPATLALTGYAILDMTFTLFLFAGSALVVTAALQNRPGRQWAGYALLAAAVLTKGPLALVLPGLAFLIAIVIASDMRRAMLRLHWLAGLAIVVALAAPWFIYMWWRFGYDFIYGYWLRENLWLYSGSQYVKTQGSFYYVKTMAVGLLPWTPLVVGRLVDVARGRGRLEVAEQLLWAWTIAIVGFFSFSQFKYDHYLYPAAPALCLLAADAWSRATRGEPDAWGVRCGALAVGLVVLVAGAILIPGMSRVPLDLPWWMRLVPLVLCAGGLLLVLEMAADRFRPPAAPASIVAALVAAYAVVMIAGLPSFERAKPIRDLARWTEGATRPDDRIATFRMHRWNSSWRFYVNRHTEVLESPVELSRFMSTPGPHYIAMTRRDYDDVVANQFPLRIMQELHGVSMTTGRALRRGREGSWRSYVVATDAGVPPAGLELRQNAPVNQTPDARSRVAGQEDGWLREGRRWVLRLLRGRGDPFGRRPHLQMRPGAPYVRLS